MRNNKATLATTSQMQEALEVYVKREDESGIVGYLVVLTEATWKGKKS